jgi:hypothetical protein
MGPAPIFFENLGENTLKGELSNATTFNPPLFSLVDTFKGWTDEEVMNSAHTQLS